MRVLPTARVAPSKVNIWEGTPVEGSPWTVEQLRVLAEERPDRKDFDSYPVELKYEQTSIWEPPPPPVMIYCPIIARTSNEKRVKIVTPRGIMKWVPAK
jgi:hypothetical protein